MPNHCETDLTISGPIKRVQECLDQYFTANGELDCNKVIPYPQHFKDMDGAAHEYDKEHPKDWQNRPKDGFNSGGYEWCISNWGTKWGTYDGAGVTLRKRSAKVSFRSAWCPPTPVFDKLAKLFPDLSFSTRSYETGVGYQINALWKKGKCVRNIESPYRGWRGG